MTLLLGLDSQMLPLIKLGETCKSLQINVLDGAFFHLKAIKVIHCPSTGAEVVRGIVFLDRTALYCYSVIISVRGCVSSL